MYLSIFSNVITGATPAEVARKTRNYGLRSVQLVPDEVNIGWGFDGNGAMGSFAEWASAYEREGIEICGIAGYVNLLHHDAQKRRHNIDLFCSMLRQMNTIGCRYISTETGSFSPSGDWNFDPRNRSAEGWNELRRVTDEVLEIAAQNNVVVLYEPYIANVCYTPELGARFVREVGSPNLALLMDPTNWFDTTNLDPPSVPAVIRRGFEAERGLFRLAHAKDITPPEPGGDRPGLPGPGQGLLDYPLYLSLLHEHGYDGALVIEHLGEDEVPAAVEFMQGALAAALPSEAQRGRD